MGQVVELAAYRLRRENVVVVTDRFVSLLWMDEKLIAADFVDSEDERVEPRRMTSAEARSLSAQLASWADAEDGAP